MDPSYSFHHGQDSPVDHFPIQFPNQLQSGLCPYHITEALLSDVTSNLLMAITPPLLFFCPGFNLFFHVIIYV